MIGKHATRREKVVACVTSAVVATCTAFACHTVAQDTVDPMAATVAQSFTMIEGSFIALADAMPAEQYGFRPTSGEFTNVRTFGEQVKHVACANYGFFNEIEQKEPAQRL